MKLTFFGAAKEVTGSCYLLEAGGMKIIIDCGLQQGQDEKNNQELPFAPGSIDHVILTHAHIDHSGRLPLMVKQGFKGQIHTTRATSELIAIMLRDSAHIQEMDAEWKNKKGARAGEETAVPIYTIQDAEATLKLVVPCSYKQRLKIADGVEAEFTDAGHLLGSASVTLWLTEDSVTKSIVFSGDIGNTGRPIIKDPQYLKTADYVVMESTYGDRNHEKTGEYIEHLAAIITDTIKKGGNVVIPSFAVGRTQELLYIIREIKERKLVACCPNFPVYVDSPLARAATRIYDGDLTGYADEETIAILKRGFHPLEFDNLHITESADESKALNADVIPKVIISSSGMCEAGRIRHHLKHNLWRSECAIVFAGYQAGGTLGRILMDGAGKVKLFGEEIAVKAQMYSFQGLSAHADKDGLIKWISSFETSPHVFVVHGETEIALGFASLLKGMGLTAVTPNFKSEYDLLTGACLAEGIPEEQIRTTAERQVRVSPAFARLLASLKRLQELVKENEFGANKDLARLADQINALIEKWQR